MTVRRAAVAGLVAVGLVAVVGASALARSGSAGTGVTAVEASTGHHLPANPMLRAGESVIITITGFASAAPVNVGFVGVRVIGSAAADGSGTVVFRYAVPQRIGPGQHALVFSGAARSTSGTPPPGNVLVSVPLTRQWPFRTPGSRPSSAPGSHGVGGVQQGSGHHLSADTGVDVIGLVTVGTLALLGGLGLLWAGLRRRRGTAVDPPARM